MTRTADEIVRAEVLCCMSSIVSTLASGLTAPESMNVTGTVLSDIAEQASWLACPIDDWEEAAIQAGWTGRHLNRHAHTYYSTKDDADTYWADSWQELCEAKNIEPYQREVFEHWAVTDWLADKLIERGEKVDKDFGGLCVWARTTTGQMISMDSVFQKLADDLRAQYGEA